MKRVLITGVNGLLGQKCAIHLKSDYTILGIDIQDEPNLKDEFRYFKGDITNRKALKSLLLSLKPDYIINTAAYTDVDGCEINKELCWKTNVEGVQNLVYVANKIDAKIIQISSDYIFDGKNGPYKEHDSPNPLGYYGKSKLASENIFFQSEIEYAILRTMILYGVGINVRPNFVTWLINKLRNGEKVTIVNDQFGNPTLADDLAHVIKRVINSEKWDIFHVSGNELLNRYSFARKIAAIFDLDRTLISPITTDKLTQVAPRPLKSGFILDKIKKELGLEMMDLDESLKIFKKQFKKLKA